MASKELDRVRQMWEDLVASLAPKDGKDATVEDFRREYENLCAHFEVPADAVFAEVDADGVPATVATGPTGSSERVVLYLHGGGYVIGTANGYRATGAALAEAADAQVFLLDYRLAPEHPFPAAVEDATAAYRWLMEQGHRPESIALAGDSAGGGLVAATLLALKAAGTPLPAAAVLMSPWTDLTISGESIDSRAEHDPIVSRDMLTLLAGLYLGEDDDPRTPTASPLHGDLTGLPPLFVLVGTSETLHDDARRFADKASAAGVDVTWEVGEDMYHVWPVFSSILPEGREALERIGRFVQERTAAGGAVAT